MDLSLISLGIALVDIPIFFPVPFQELSSVQYFTLEEQLTQLTDQIDGHTQQLNHAMGLRSAEADRDRKQINDVVQLVNQIEHDHQSMTARMSVLTDEARREREGLTGRTHSFLVRRPARSPESPAFVPFVGRAIPE